MRKYLSQNGCFNVSSKDNPHEGRITASGLQNEICHLELAIVSQPVDHFSTILVRQQLQQKLPQLYLTVVA